MYEKRSSIHSDVRNNNDDDDEQLLELTSPLHDGHENISLNIIDEPIIGINSDGDKDSDIDNLLGEMQIDQPISNSSRCSNVPARYVIAIWIFFGFFCLYAMQVNLSIAIVAMVRLLENVKFENRIISFR